MYGRIGTDDLIEENGTDPISGEALTKEDLIDVKASEFCRNRGGGQMMSRRDMERLEVNDNQSLQRFHLDLRTRPLSRLYSPRYNRNTMPLCLSLLKLRNRTRALGENTLSSKELV